MYFIFEKISDYNYKQSIVETPDTAICTIADNSCLEIDNTSDTYYSKLFRILNYYKIYREDGTTPCTKADLIIINCDVFKKNLESSKLNNWKQKYLKNIDIYQSKYLKNTDKLVYQSNSDIYQSKYLKYKQKYLALKKLLNKN